MQSELHIAKKQRKMNKETTTKEALTDTKPVLADVLLWENFKKANPHAPYEQSEKFGHYDQRVCDYYNDLYVTWLKLSQHVP